MEDFKMKIKSLFLLIGIVMSVSLVEASYTLVSPNDLKASRNGQITAKEHSLLNSLSAAVSGKNYPQAYTLLSNLYTFIKARSDMFISEIPTIVNPVGKEISRMIQVTRSNQIDSIMVLDSKIDHIVQPLRDVYHRIMQQYHNQSMEQRSKQQTHLTDQHVEAEQIYSNVIAPADTIQKILIRLERLFIIAHLRNFYFLTTKTGSYGSNRDDKDHLTGQQHSPFLPNTNQQSSSTPQDKNSYP